MLNHDDVNNKPIFLIRQTCSNYNKKVSFINKALLHAGTKRGV